MAFSSIVPNELKINKELINIAIKNIFESWFTSSSYAPSPSVSIIKHGNSSLLFFIIIGSDHIHIPFVHGLKVGPTENPVVSLLFKMTLFNRNDFPVLYFPTKLIIPICLIFFWFSNNLDWFVIINLPFSYIIKGTAALEGIFSNSFFCWGISSKSFSLRLLMVSKWIWFLNEFSSSSIFDIEKFWSI